MRDPSLAGCTRPYMAVPPVCRSPPCVLAAVLVIPVRGMPSWIDEGDDPLSVQSCPRIVAPSRQRPARTNARLVRPLPALRAAMQNGMHGAVGMHASSAFRAVSCPHRGTSQTVASSSRHVPLEMQSCVVPAPASYRVYDHRTDLTYRSTPAHVYRPAAAGSENCASSR